MLVVLKLGPVFWRYSRQILKEVNNMGSELDLTEKSWLSIEDKLPQDDYPKLFYNDKTNHVGLFAYKNGLFYDLNPYNSLRLMSQTEITHWFDIPQPPVKDEFKNKRRLIK